MVEIVKNRGVDILERSIGRGVVSHAYLFYGPKDTGKFQKAVEMAKNICRGDDNLAKQDILTLEPETVSEKGKIKELDMKVGEVRELQRKIGLSSQGNFRVAIIKKSEKMTVSAQNALLKTLEEPPKGVVLILLTENKEKLLPTVVSRCQKVRFGILSETRLRQIFSGKSFSEEVVFWSLGREGLAKKMLENGEELRFRKETENFLKNIFHSNVSEKFLAAEEMSKDIAEAKEKMILWSVILREIILGRNRSGFEGLLDKQEALDILGKIDDSLKTIEETNANTRLVLENLFLSF